MYLFHNKSKLQPVREGEPIWRQRVPLERHGYLRSVRQLVPVDAALGLRRRRRVLGARHGPRKRSLLQVLYDERQKRYPTNDLCGNQFFTARSCRIIAASFTPSTRRLFDGVAMPVPYCSTVSERRRHRREMT